MMRKLQGIATALLMAHGAQLSADDIEIYLNGDSASGTPYLHLMLDYRPSVFNTLCTYGSSCAPPFMTKDAYDNLTDQGFSDGDKVSTFAGFVAVIQTVMDSY